MTRRKWTYWVVVRIPFWWIVTSILVVLLLKWVPVRCTPVMLKRAFQFRKVENYRSEQVWVPLEKVSPEIVQAVIAAEDSRFLLHKGFDRVELEKMWKEHGEKGRKIRGCSTISQQTAKNVFTFGSRTWVRKGLEVYWTVLIEWIWGKRRIMEVYLNVIETGKGLYGVEAASRHYYDKSAAKVDRKQAVAIAACLPSPLRETPTRPSARASARRNRIMRQLPLPEKLRKLPE